MFALVLAANVVTPLWADDYCRIAPPRLLEPFAIAWRDYFEWTGRFFATALTYDALSLVEAWSPVPFDVLNAAVFAFLVDQGSIGCLWPVAGTLWFARRGVAPGGGRAWHFGAAFVVGRSSSRAPSHRPEPDAAFFWRTTWARHCEEPLGDEAT